MFGSGTTILLISNEEINDNIKMVKSLDKLLAKQFKMKQNNTMQISQYVIRYVNC